MLGRRTFLVMAVLSLLLFPVLSSAPASGHAPEFPSGNNSIETAWEVHDAEKSWALYATLPEGKANYYQIDYSKGDKILINLIIPVSENDRGFLPVMALIGPGLFCNCTLPSLIEVPEGSGYLLVPSDPSGEPEFEPFSPGSFVELSVLDIEAPETGTYFVAIWEDDSSVGIGGNYAFPVGFTETFELKELVLMPFSLLRVYDWEGQDPLTIFAPLIIMLLLGFGLFIRKRYQLVPRMRPLHYAAYFAGILIGGSGLIVTVQLLRSTMESSVGGMVLVTLSFIAAELLIAFYLFRTGYSGRRMTTGPRFFMFVLGLVSIFVWAGYLIGPAMAMIGALLPSARRKGGNQ